MFSAYRSELVSINAATYLILQLCVTEQVTGGSFILYNNCSKAQKSINSSSWKFKRYTQDDFDVISETQNTINRLRQLTSFTMAWVKGHFSGEKEIQHIMNEEAHRLAVSALSLTKTDTSTTPPPTSLVTLRVDHPLTSKGQAILKERANAVSLRKMICKNTNWSKDQFDMVDWAALQSCLK
jgi:hypothetical protein